MLEVKALEKSYGSKHAVRGVSFAVEKGTVLGFLGPNGAGTSTTMRMIAGVLEPDSGDALIDGKSIISDRRAAQASLGYLPEGAPLYEDMTPPAIKLPPRRSGGDYRRPPMNEQPRSTDGTKTPAPRPAGSPTAGDAMRCLSARYPASRARARIHLRPKFAPVPTVLGSCE
jgi:energy-coupling factor transporter ATP-binding protein EcfA2